VKDWAGDTTHLNGEHADGGRSTVDEVPVITLDLGRRVLVLLSPVQDSGSGDEPDSIDRSVPQSDALGDFPASIRRYPQVLGERTLGRELAAVDHPGDLVADLELVGVRADRGDGDNRSGKVATDDGAGDREAGDGGVLPVYSTSDRPKEAI
jgi:hypothetical protein